MKRSNAAFLAALMPLLLTTTPRAGHAASFFPPAMNPYAQPHAEPLGAHFGSAVSSAGDVNGDGYADFLVGDWGYDASRGRAYLYFGGKKGDNFADITLSGENPSDNMGNSVAGAGDVNGDGYDDVIVGAPNWSGTGANVGRAYLYLGGPGMDSTPDLVLTGETSLTFFGYSVAGAGDLNHDGYDDFVVGAHGYGSEHGRAYVYYGSPMPGTTPAFALTGRSAGDRFGFSVASAGDVNGDTYSDLVVGAPGYSSQAGRAYLFFGGAAADTTEDQVYTGQTVGEWCGTSVSTAGDVNLDGFGDLIIGAPNHASNRGRVYVFTGAAYPGNVAAATLAGENAGDYFGLSVASIDDANRDGKGDTIVGAPGASSFGGRVYVYFSALDPLGHISFGATGPAGPQKGWSVAGAGDVDGDGYPDVLIGSPAGQVPPSQPAANGHAQVLSVYPYRITAPNGGEQWVVGEKAFVKWVVPQLQHPTDIWLSRDGGGSWGLIVSGAKPSFPSSGSEFSVEVTVPGPAAQTALIRLSPNGWPVSQATSDVSDAVFQIVDAAVPSKIAVQSDSPEISALGSSQFETMGLSLSGADWDGDGFSDVAIGAPGSPGAGTAGRVVIYKGGAKTDGVADLTLNGQTLDDQFGAAVAFAGDLNGDGHSDLAVGAPLRDASGPDAGRVSIYFGGPAADGTADLAIDGISPGSHFGSTVAGAGDVNGDGAADLLIGTGVDVGYGATYLFLGGALMDGTADLTLDEEGAFGTSIASAGDVNRDGYADILVGAPADGSGPGMAFLYYGGPTLDSTPGLIFTRGSTFGAVVAGAGDLNGDGYSDFTVAEPGEDRAHVYLGGPSLDPAGNLILKGVLGEGFATDIQGVGDVNGDSYPDLAVGAPFSSAAGSGAGRVQIFFGGRGMDGAPDVSIATPAFGASAYAGYRVARGGDFLGDGFGDILVGAPAASVNGSLSGGAALYDVNRFQLVGPNGGGAWQVGATTTISWHGAEPADVLLSTDGGNSYATLAANVGGKSFNTIGVLVPHTPTKFARVKVVPRDLLATPPNPIVPPSPVVPPSPILPPSPIVAGSDQSDSLFTINASVSLLALMAAPAPQGVGAVITWNTDPGPENLKGYRLDKAIGSGPWRILAALTRETRVEDRDAGPASRYRLYSVNGLDEELLLGEAVFRPRAPLAAWPLPYRGGNLSIAFATSGGLGGAAGKAEVGVFDVRGRLVRRVAAGDYMAGYQSAAWDGRDDHGRRVGAGVYLLRSISGGAESSMKVVVAR